MSIMSWTEELRANGVSIVNFNTRKGTIKYLNSSCKLQLTFRPLRHNCRRVGWHFKRVCVCNAASILSEQPQVKRQKSRFYDSAWTHQIHIPGHGGGGGRSRCLEIPVCVRQEKKHKTQLSGWRLWQTDRLWKPVSLRCALQHQKLT